MKALNSSSSSRAESTTEYSAYTNIPYSLLSEELSGLYGNSVLREMSDLIGFYRGYENGVPFINESTEDGYTASDLSFKQARNLINRQARFMFAVPPDFKVSIPYDRKVLSQKRAVEKNQSILQTLVDNVMKENQIGKKLVNAAKDCFIAKRVAYVVNFDEKKERITISFVPSLGFVYETEEDNLDVLSKLVIFYSTNEETEKTNQRIYKKKYYMDSGVCKIVEGVYDGLGNLVLDEKKITTKFPYILGGVILNDGLTGDLSGVSEMEQLEEFEAGYNKIANSDIDAERKNMNPVAYAIDIDPETTKGLSRNPGAFWDLSSDQNTDEGSSSGGKIGILESGMNYSVPLGSTLDRIRASAFETAEVPDVSAKALQGVVSSGKTLKTIYWTLMVRCQEKFLSWEPALEHIVNIIIDGAYLYKTAASRYLKGQTLPAIDNYEVVVLNNYPIQDDQTEEKTSDLDEVTAGVRSRKSYMQKWNGLSDDEVEEELQQIVKERQLNESSFLFPPLDSKDQDKKKAAATGEEDNGDSEAEEVTE